MFKTRFSLVCFAIFMCLSLTHCTTYPPLREAKALSDYTYVIGPGDELNILVWDNPELSSAVSVRPDGKITMPWVEDLLANGKTPAQLARDIEKMLVANFRDPQVVVMVANYKGIKAQQIRVIGRIGGGSSGGSSGSMGGGAMGAGMGGNSSGGSGSASIGRYQGKSIPYERGMTLLDVMIVIGLNQYADGNRSTIIRNIDGKVRRYSVRIDDLIDEADLSANVEMMPGDILIIPESYF